MNIDRLVKGNLKDFFDEKKIIRYFLVEHQEWKIHFHQRIVLEISVSLFLGNVKKCRKKNVEKKISKKKYRNRKYRKKKISK